MKFFLYSLFVAITSLLLFLFSVGIGALFDRITKIPILVYEVLKGYPAGIIIYFMLVWGVGLLLKRKYSDLTDYWKMILISAIGIGVIFGIFLRYL